MSLSKQLLKWEHFNQLYFYCPNGTLKICWDIELKYLTFVTYVILLFTHMIFPYQICRISIKHNFQCDKFRENILLTASNNQFRNYKSKFSQFFWPIRTSFFTIIIWLHICYWFFLKTKCWLIKNSGLVVGSGEQDKSSGLLSKHTLTH
jgi:hypothetical protein